MVLKSNRVANPVDGLFFWCIFGAIRIELVETIETVNYISTAEWKQWTLGNPL